MGKFKMIYKLMYDDLKDSEMIIDYAYDLKEDNETTLATTMATYAQERMTHFMKMHELFDTEMKGLESKDKESVHECLWNETHKMLLDWKDKIEKCITKF